MSFDCRRLALLFFAPVFFLGLAPTGAHADTAPRLLGRHGGWVAYELAQGKGQVCYVVADPKTRSPAKPARAAHFLITHRPADKAFDVVSIVPGFALPKNGAATLAVDRKSFTLFTDETTAWASDSATDKAVATAMAQGKSVTFKTKGARGQAASDIYALAGFKPALAQIDKACRVRH